MDWKSEAVDKLKQYEAKRQALVSLPLEIAQVESTMTSIRSARMDGVAVKGSGSSGRENMMLSCIVQRDELQRNLDRTKMWVDSVSGALSVLQADDRHILERVYIYAEPKAVERLLDEYGLTEPSGMYKRIKKAIREFTIAMYGVVES